VSTDRSFAGTSCCRTEKQLRNEEKITSMFSKIVIPAQAGNQFVACSLDSRLRGKDGNLQIIIPSDLRLCAISTVVCRLQLEKQHQRKKSGPRTSQRLFDLTNRSGAIEPVRHSSFEAPRASVIEEPVCWRTSFQTPVFNNALCVPVGRFDRLVLENAIA